jgi:hypothetical protein
LRENALGVIAAGDAEEDDHGLEEKTFCRFKFFAYLFYMPCKNKAETKKALLFSKIVSTAYFLAVRCGIISFLFRIYCK